MTEPVPARGGWPAVSRHLATVLSTIALLGALVACTDDPVNLEPILPSGPELLATSADVMARVDSAHVVLELEPPVGGLPIARGEGDLTRRGDARGTITLRQGGQPVQLDYVLIEGGPQLLRWPTGPDWLPAGLVTSLYDPSAVLDPARGVARLLETATDARLAGSDELEGVAAWRVEATFAQRGADAIVPGVPDGVTGSVWIARDTGHLLQVVLDVPATDSSPASVVTLRLTDFDADVTITAPQ